MRERNRVSISQPRYGTATLTIQGHWHKNFPIDQKCHSDCIEKFEQNIDFIKLKRTYNERGGCNAKLA
jgi:hypothetical protein